MSCNKECTQQPTCPETNCGRGNGNGYLCMVVLYILLVIILGSLIVC